MPKNKKILPEISEARKLTQHERKSFRISGGRSVTGRLYMFKYASKTGNTQYPVILLVNRMSGRKHFRARVNRRDYIAGIVINEMTNDETKSLLEVYSKENKNKDVLYHTIQRLGAVYVENYRCYDFKKVHNFSLVDIDIYLETL
jgi:hypothetical protein